jgi:phage terminase large subunit
LLQEVANSQRVRRLPRNMIVDGNDVEFIRKRGRPRKLKSVRKEKGPIGRPLKTVGMVPITSSVVFHWNRQADAQIIINRGGSRSTKSWSIAQLLIEWFFTIPRIKILILRKTQPSLRVSVIPQIFTLLELYNLRSRIVEVKQDRNLWSPVKGLIHFGGLDDPEKIRSTDWNVIWMEEATEFEYDDFINLKLRLSTPTYGTFRNKLFMSFNPVDEYSWIKTKIADEQTEDFIDIHSNYLYNPFLSEDYIRTVEMLQFQDPNYWRIFGLGEWGKLEHIIYSNWTISPYLMDGETIFGLDFGFNNPSSLIQINVDGLEAGVQQKVYQSGLTNSDLIQKMNLAMTADQKSKCPIYADSAEPQRIEELNREGFWVVPANKSVKDGIDFVKRVRLRITDDSDNIKKEVKGYSYRTDKNSRVLEEPIKFNDHAMDAIRYALFTHNQGNIQNTLRVREFDFTPGSNKQLNDVLTSGRKDPWSKDPFADSDMW